jgi:hypothetical protein
MKTSVLPISNDIILRISALLEGDAQILRLC